jgi:hypothetical protein
MNRGRRNGVIPPRREKLRWTKLWADIDTLLASLDRKPESRAPETRR